MKTNVGTMFFELWNFLEVIDCTRSLIRQPLKLVTAIWKIWNQLFLAYNWQILCSVEENYGCNSRVNSDSPMLSKCLTPQVIYEEKVTKCIGKELKIYGSTETTFKERHWNHKKLFRDHLNDSELSKYM